MNNVVTDTVKLSKHTLSVLKNFSSLNSNILIRTGNLINTITPAKNVVAQAKVEENFPVEFGVWDLNKFLGTISLFHDPEFCFGEKAVTIKGNNNATVSYYYSEPRLLTTLTKEIKMPETVVHFELSEETFNDIQKAASVLQLPDLCIQSNDEKGTIELVVLEKKSSTTNNYLITVGENPDLNSSFKFYLKVENLKILPGDYSVSVSKNVVSKFENKNCDLIYYIALETDSKHVKD